MLQNINQNKTSPQGHRRTRHSWMADLGLQWCGGSHPGCPHGLRPLEDAGCTRPAATGTTWYEHEVFATLSLFSQNKSRGSSSLSVGRGNSSWREEKRKTFGFELLLGHFAQGGTAVITCRDSRLLQPGAALAGLAGRVSAQGHSFQAGSFVHTNLNHKENSNRWKHIDARRQTHLNQAFDAH